MDSSYCKFLFERYREALSQREKIFTVDIKYSVSKELDIKKYHAGLVDNELRDLRTLMTKDCKPGLKDHLASYLPARAGNQFLIFFQRR